MAQTESNDSLPIKACDSRHLGRQRPGYDYPKLIKANFTTPVSCANVNILVSGPSKQNNPANVTWRKHTGAPNPSGIVASYRLYPMWPTWSSRITKLFEVLRHTHVFPRLAMRSTEVVVSPKKNRTAVSVLSQEIHTQP